MKDGNGFRRKTSAGQITTPYSFVIPIPSPIPKEFGLKVISIFNFNAEK